MQMFLSSSQHNSAMSISCSPHSTLQAQRYPVSTNGDLLGTGGFFNWKKKKDKKPTQEIWKERGREITFWCEMGGREGEWPLLLFLFCFSKFSFIWAEKWLQEKAQLFPLPLPLFPSSSCCLCPPIYLLLVYISLLFSALLLSCLLRAHLHPAHTQLFLPKSTLSTRKLMPSTQCHVLLGHLALQMEDTAHHPSSLWMFSCPSQPYLNCVLSN